MWMVSIKRVNKPNGCIMTSYNSNDRSKNVKNSKIKPRIYMVILIVVATIIIMTKAITLMKTATKTATRIII